MHTVLVVLAVLAMVATVGMLLAGLVGVARGSPDPARSNRLMRYRVVFQGVAVLLFIVLLSLMQRT